MSALERGLDEVKTIPGGRPHILQAQYYAFFTPVASVRRPRSARVRQIARRLCRCDFRLHRFAINCRKLQLSPLRGGCYSDAAGALGRCSSCAPPCRIFLPSAL
jgi:hypothetical protein